MIKTHHTGNIDTFREVISAASVPIVIADGPKTREDRDFLQLVKKSIQAGAKAICMGRNVWQRQNTKGMLTTLCHIVHDNAEVEEVMEIV